MTKGKTTLLDFGDEILQNRFIIALFKRCKNTKKIFRQFGVLVFNLKEFKEELENFLENELDAAKAKLIELNTWNDIQGFLEEQAKKKK